MAVSDLKTFFQSNPLMALFSDEELDECVKASKVVEFNAGVDVAKRGETHNSSWIIYDGEVGVSIPGEGVMEELLTHLEKGRIFGDMSVLKMGQ
jgi:signal-transduction protein with cAMP-binding, CBS, and nucleotidyltransferase domain